MQPDVDRRIRFLEHERHGHKRQQAPTPVAKFKHGQSDDQHDEKVEQGPTLDPTAVHAIHTGGAKQPPAGRKVEDAGHFLKIMFPAHSRHRAETRPFVARFGHQVQRAAPELHARQFGRPMFRDDAVHPVHRDAPEFERRPHGHVPLAAQRAFELVLEGKTAAVKI